MSWRRQELSQVFGSEGLSVAPGNKGELQWLVWTGSTGGQEGAEGCRDPP